MTQRNPSAITTTLEVDPPLAQNAGFTFDRNDRQYIDNQIRGVQQHLVAALIRGRHATYVLVDGASASLVAGDNVCFSAETLEARVTKCTAAALTDAVAAFGVVVLPAAPGSMALIAFGGVLPRLITGLALNAAGFVRVNTTTGRCERVATLGVGDYGIGVVSKSGQMLVVPGIGSANTVGSSFTAGGDLSGTSSSQTVEKVKGTTITTAGGALPVGATLRTTAAGVADWGPLDLADSDARTGVLPRANQQDQTLAGDTTGTTGANVVEAISGSSSVATVRATAPTIQWVTATTSPTINQAANTTNSATAQNLAIAAQNATGTTSTGGNLVLSAGSGTSANGAVRIAVNGSTGVQITPSNSGQSVYQVVTGAASVLFQQASVTGSTATGAAWTIQAQNATGASATGGALNLTSGSGGVLHGNLNLQVGGTTRLQLTPTQASDDLLKSDGTAFVRFAKGGNSTYLGVNGSGVVGYYGITASQIGSLPGSSPQLLYNNGGAFGATANASYSGGGIELTSSGFLAWINGGATSGLFRLKSGALREIINTDDGIGGNRSLLQFSSVAGALTLGHLAYNTFIDGAIAVLNVGGVEHVRAQANLVQLRPGNTTAVSASTTDIKTALPLAGDSSQSLPFRFKTATIAFSGSSITATAAQYECPLIVTTGTGPGSGQLTLALPAQNGAFFDVINLVTYTLVVSHTVGGSGVSLVNGASKTAAYTTAAGLYY